MPNNLVDAAREFFHERMGVIYGSVLYDIDKEYAIEWASAFTDQQVKLAVAGERGQLFESFQQDVDFMVNPYDFFIQVKAWFEREFSKELQDGK